MRVKVWNGDQSKYLGEGDYVDDVTVYFIAMPDGSLKSGSNAEEKPDELPEGGRLIESDRNPKIVLDSGQTVYGCQVWWQPIKSAKPEPKTLSKQDFLDMMKEEDWKRR